MPDGMWWRVYDAKWNLRGSHPTDGLEGAAGYQDMV